MIDQKELRSVAKIIMGLSPEGSTYNIDGIGKPLLNGPTEFGLHHPEPKLFTIDSKRECLVNDLIFCVRGSTTGRMNWADQKYSLGRGVCAIRGKTDLHTKYIRYCLDLFLPSLLNLAGGSTFPNLNKDDIGKFKIPYPENIERIASILSAYDDLIEVNNQRIKLLEQTARELYKEWFVRMRFPGYKQAKFKKGVPEGWEIGKIGNLYEVKSGFAFKGDLLGMEGYPVIKITNIQNGNIDLDNCDRYSGELNKRIEKFELFEGDLLIAMTGAQIGKVGLVSSLNERYFLNQRVGKFFPKKEFLTNNAFAYFTSNSEYFQAMIENYGMGAAQPNISGEQIEKINCIIPSDEILKRFNSICEPIFKQTAILKTQNTQLRQIRDRLLPRLISGKLQVSESRMERING